MNVQDYLEDKFPAIFSLYLASLEDMVIDTFESTNSINDIEHDFDSPFSPTFLTYF